MTSLGRLSLHASQKQFHSMAEALAERLLDLHCRLLSLYVLQDADSLHWENARPFFEGERGSVTVQMWWLYMQGARWVSVIFPENLLTSRPQVNPRPDPRGDNFEKFCST